MITPAVDAQCERCAVGGLDVDLLASFEGVHLSSGGAVDTHVDDHHDYERYVEGDEGRKYKIIDVVRKHARVEQVLFSDGPPVGDCRKRDARRAEPNKRDKHHPVAS